MECMTDKVKVRGIAFFSWLMGGCREDKARPFLVVDSKRGSETSLPQMKFLLDIRKKVFTMTVVKQRKEDPLRAGSS